MTDESKNDATLGLRVNKHLDELGINTPIVNSKTLFSDDDEKRKKIESSFGEIMDALGLDRNDDSLVETPKRFAKMYVNDKFWGLDPANFPKCTTVSNKTEYDQLLSCDKVRVLSDCEHHFITIDGFATIAYIPKNKLLGLSKISRVVKYFCKRPQLQERLTQQIGEALKFILEVEDIAVHIRAKHYCVISRGVEDQCVETKSTFLSGSFRHDQNCRSEFLASIK